MDDPSLLFVLLVEKRLPTFAKHDLAVPRYVTSSYYHDNTIVVLIIVVSSTPDIFLIIMSHHRTCSRWCTCPTLL